jgi:hypothetical protein
LETKLPPLANTNSLVRPTFLFPCFSLPTPRHFRALTDISFLPSTSSDEDVVSFLGLAGAIENVGVSAYLGAASKITDPEYLTAAAAILTTEARHQAWIASAGSAKPKGPPFSGAYDTPRASPSPCFPLLFCVWNLDRPILVCLLLPQSVSLKAIRLPLTSSPLALSPTLRSSFPSSSLMLNESADTLSLSIFLCYSLPVKAFPAAMIKDSMYKAGQQVSLDFPTTGATEYRQSSLSFRRHP